MTRKNTRAANLTLTAILSVYFVIACAILFKSSQNIIWDASMALKMAENPKKGIPFNFYAHPDPKNLSLDQFEYVTWWSPGQFALPMLLMHAFNIKLAAAVKLLTLISLFISALGVFKLYRFILTDRSFGIPPEQVLTVCLALLVFTVIQPLFWSGLGLYDGGGVLMLAYCPWFIFFAVKYGGLKPIVLTLLLIGGLFGFFLKSAFTAVFAGSLVYLALTDSDIRLDAPQKIDYRKLIKNTLIAGAMFLVYFLVIKFAFLSHNRGISESSEGIRLQPRVFVYPWIAPLLGLFSLNNLNKTSQWIVALTVVVPMLYFILRSKSLGPHYKLLLISFAGTSIAFYTALYFLNVDVSYELRHYRLISVLLIPAFFLGFKRVKYLNYVVYAALALYSIYGAYTYVHYFGIASDKKDSYYRFSGLRSSYPAEVLNKIYSLDDASRNGRSIFYFQSSDPAVALEIKHNRVLLEDNFVNFHFNNRPRFDKLLYYNVNPAPLYIVYPLSNFKADSTKYLTRFAAYKHFDRVYKSAGFVILKGVPAPQP
jgi:hypothetical protein